MDWQETQQYLLGDVGTVCCGNSGRKHKALNQGSSYGDGDKIYSSDTWRTYGLKKEGVRTSGGFVWASWKINMLLTALEGIRQRGEIRLAWWIFVYSLGTCDITINIFSMGNVPQMYSLYGMGYGKVPQKQQRSKQKSLGGGGGEQTGMTEVRYDRKREWASLQQRQET